ncbi:MAG: acetolactate synthase small subunit [Propionibacteriaceae bacterium]|jgi:acetolactate synthase-1/3 small subunit|nr:acetolactate synthase small subunit [Propionibacteriaceae bacterium]
MSSIHTLSVLVEDKPGVLARIAGLFARRGFNIESLAVGPTERDGYSRITLVAVTESPEQVEQIVKQLNKLVEVIRITEMEKGNAVRRELVLVKVKADPANRGEIVQLAEMFRGHVIDVSADSLTIEATGGYGKLRALLDLLEPYGVRELVQSGSVALGRGARAMTDRSKHDRSPKADRKQ